MDYRYSRWHMVVHAYIAYRDDSIVSWPDPDTVLQGMAPLHCSDSLESCLSEGQKQAHNSIIPKALIPRTPFRSKNKPLVSLTCFSCALSNSWALYLFSFLSLEPFYSLKPSLYLLGPLLGSLLIELILELFLELSLEFSLELYLEFSIEISLEVSLEVSVFSWVLSWAKSLLHEVI